MGDHVGGGGVADVLREHLVERRRSDVAVEVLARDALAVVDDGELQDRGQQLATGEADRIKGQLGGLTLLRGERGDVDQRGHVGVVDVGDHRATVGMSDQHDRPVDRGECAFDRGGIVGGTAQRIVRDHHAVTVRAQGLGDTVPAGRIGERTVNQHHGRGVGGQSGCRRAERARTQADRDRDRHVRSEPARHDFVLSSSKILANAHATVLLCAANDRQALAATSTFEYEWS